MLMQKSIMLIHPPVSVPAAPPAGMARLAGFLRKSGVACLAVDLNLYGLLKVAGSEITANDTWTRRAKTGLDKNLAALRSCELYKDRDRYKRAVQDVNRVLHMAGSQRGIKLSLSNYVDPCRSPLLSRDLMQAALDFKNNLFFPFFEKRIEAMVKDNNFQVFGISVNFISQALCSAAIAGFIRKHFPNSRIVFGGGLITSWMKIPGFSNPLPGIVDDMISGPGERILAAMCAANAPEDEGVIKYGNNRSQVPGYPYDYEQDEYLSPGLVFPISASDGCYWRKCAFCPEKEEQNIYRPFSPRKISSLFQANGVAWGSDQLNCVKKQVLIHYTDNALSPKFMQHIIDNPPGSPWYGFARITSHLADPGFVAGLVASGCIMLKLGIESGDQKVLDTMGKGTSVTMVSRVLKTLKTCGISVYGYLLFGTPAENERSAIATRDFILAHSDCIDFLNLAIFNLPAYGGMADKLQTRAFYPGDLSLYREFVHPEGWNREHIRKFLSKVFQSDKTVRNIILNDPPFFTSNHAPFFRMHQFLMTS